MRNIVNLVIKYFYFADDDNDDDDDVDYVDDVDEDENDDEDERPSQVVCVAEDEETRGPGPRLNLRLFSYHHQQHHHHCCHFIVIITQIRFITGIIHKIMINYLFHQPYVCHFDRKLAKHNFENLWSLQNY